MTCLEMFILVERNSWHSILDRKTILFTALFTLLPKIKPLFLIETIGFNAYVLF